MSRKRDGRSTARFVGRCAWPVFGKVESSELAKRFCLRGGIPGGGRQRRRLECSGYEALREVHGAAGTIEGQGDAAERKRAKFLPEVAARVNAYCAADPDEIRH